MLLDLFADTGLDDDIDLNVNSRILLDLPEGDTDEKKRKDTTTTTTTNNNKNNNNNNNNGFKFKSSLGNSAHAAHLIESSRPASVKWRKLKKV